MPSSGRSDELIDFAAGIQWSQGDNDRLRALPEPQITDEQYLAWLESLPVTWEELRARPVFQGDPFSLE
jgi:hypothetical protein